jgi:hypothetical protein
MPKELDKVYIIDSFDERLAEVEMGLGSGLASTLPKEYFIFSLDKPSESELATESTDNKNLLRQIDQALEKQENVLVVLNYLAATYGGMLEALGKLENKHGKGMRILIHTCKSHHKLKKFVKRKRAEGVHIPKFRRIYYDGENVDKSLTELSGTILGTKHRANKVILG